jgi:hypothetical protein
LSFKKEKSRRALSSGFAQVDQHSKSAPNLSEHAGKMKLESLEQSIRKRDDSESLDGNVQHVSNKPAPNSPSKLFSKKLKHERMGYMDPRSVRNTFYRHRNFSYTSGRCWVKKRQNWILQSPIFHANRLTKTLCWMIH